MSNPKTKSPPKGRVLSRAANLPVGGGALRTGRKIVAVYGTYKVRKTGGIGQSLPDADWMVSDSNCVPTLEELGVLPPPERLHEIENLEHGCEVIDKYLNAGDENVKNGQRDNPLGIPAFVTDSLTQISEWHQADTARATSQTYMGQNPKEGGWQKFNAEFIRLIDKLAELARYTNVVLVLHAKDKLDVSKGQYAGFQLPPAMAAKVGRTVNWILYQTLEREPFGESDKLLEGFDTVEEGDDGKYRVRVAYHTRPVYGYSAVANGRLFRPIEPVDIGAMLRKAGAL